MITFLVVEESVVAHEDPVVVEGGGRSTRVEDARVVLENLLEGFQMTWVRLCVHVCV